MRCSPGRLDLAGMVLGGLSIGYPIVAIASMQDFGAWPILALICLLLLRLAVPAARPLPADLLWATLLVAGVIAGLALFSADLAVRIYPVAINLALLQAFARTLWRPPSMIERFARLVEPELNAAGIRYTRQVTMVWVAFFAVNGGAALWLALFGSWLAWAIWTGALSYLLAGLLFALEYLVRGRMRQRRAAAE